jgi:hypothetical protein
MALYQLKQDSISRVDRESFVRLRIDERRDLQRILRDNFEVIAPGVLIIAEEFSEWEDSRRRIDLLGIDGDGNLVVIELKRTEDGGHMDLQSVRYAAMVSTLTYRRIISILANFLEKNGRREDPEKLLLNHLGWGSADDGEVAARVRIVLVSSDFSTEVTTTVLWLNDQQLDIRCVRLIPYLHGTDVLLDIQQVIPLPEASDYMVRAREKKEEKQSFTVRRQNRDFTRFKVTTGDETFSNLPKRRAIHRIVSFLIEKGTHPDEIQLAIPLERSNFFKIPGKWEGEEFAKAVGEHCAGTGQSFDVPRWFTAPGECFHVGDFTYVFSKMWGSRTLDSMNALIEHYSNFDIKYEAEAE